MALRLEQDKRQKELKDFRKIAKAPVSVAELDKLQKDIYNQSSDLGRDVAEVYFEDQCLNQLTSMCNDLRQAGYKVLTVFPAQGSFLTKMELRASPKCQGAPLWGIAKKYFSESTSCGGDSLSDIQGLSILFPNFLMGEYDLCRGQSLPTV